MHFLSPNSPIYKIHSCSFLDMDMRMTYTSDCISSSIAQNRHFHYSKRGNKCWQICPSLASATVGIKHLSKKAIAFEPSCSLHAPFQTVSAVNTRNFGPKETLHCSRMANQCLDGINKRDEFVEVANKLADVAGQIIRQYFRKHFDVVEKDDSSPVTIADRAAEEAMRAIISDYFPSHAIYGEENGWTCKEENAEYVWVLDPIDGTKSFITGKPLFGTLIALVHKGIPIVGIIDQPILRERWIGKIGEKTTLNGQEISTRSCDSLDRAYMYTTSPHLFSGQAEEAFARVRNKVKVPLYGCDCYAYALLASGHVDLVIESGLKPYDFMALIPVVEGAGGVITDWIGQKLTWGFSADGCFPSYNVIAAGDAHLHEAALTSLHWN